MAEWPEIHRLQTQMHEELCGRTIANLINLQPKCSNVSPEELSARTEGAAITEVVQKGKWILTHLDNEQTLLLSLGMGADVFYTEEIAIKPPKYQIALELADGGGYTARFWWFGMFHIANTGELSSEPNTAHIGIEPFAPEFTKEWLINNLKGRRGQIKAYMLNQKNIGGIGNMYAHDILFQARLHPKALIQSMDDEAISRLHGAIQGILGKSMQLGAFAYEKDFYGKGGAYTEADFLVGYREDKPCPTCGAAIQTFKAGGSASYICPVCQVL